MSFTPSFTIGQSALAPNIITATDTSAGSDVLITARHITFTTAQGTTLVVSGTSTSYNLWALASTTKDFDVLTEDMALSIRVDWVDSLGISLYDLTQSYCLAYFNKQFLYELVQDQALNPNILQDTNYNSNVATFWTTIIGAINAVEFGNDIAASQASLSRGTEMRLNQSKYF